MIRLIRYFILSMLLSGFALAQVVVINPGPRPPTPYDPPPGDAPITVRPDPTKPGQDFNGRYYEYCGPAPGYRCNLMRSDGVARMRDEANASKQQQLASYKGNLNAESAKVDKDLEKLREGLIDPASKEGIYIKQKRDAAAAHKSNTAVISDSTLTFQETAKREISSTIDTSFGLAFKEGDKKDYEPEARRMNLIVGERFIKSKIRMEQERADAIETKIKEGIYTDKERRLEMVGNGRIALEISAESLQAGDTGKSDFALKVGKVLLDLSLSINPITAWPKDLAEATSGRNFVSGEELSGFEHTMAWVGVLTGGVGSKLAIVGKAAVLIGIINKARGAEKAADALKLADNAGDLIGNASKWGLKSTDEIADYAAQVEKYRGPIDPYSIPYWKGAGPQPGVVALNDLSKSNKALQNYNVPDLPGKGGAIEYIYDMKTNTFATGLAEGFVAHSPHQSLAASIKVTDTSQMLGGTLKRNPIGGFFTNENSGHFNKLWNESNRKKFVDEMSKLGIDITHSGSQTF